MESSTGGVLMLVGSATFLVGALIAVPRVFTEPDRHERLRMIEARVTAWRLGQPLYAVGTILAAVGVGFLEGDAPADRPWFLASSVLLVVGALAWSWSVYRRAVEYRAFALGELSGWAYATYVWCTLAGLLLLGIGMLVGGWPAWLGWVTLVADAMFLGAYLRFGDLPPFVFYVLLSVVGVAVL